LCFFGSKIINHQLPQSRLATYCHGALSGAINCHINRQYPPLTSWNAAGNGVLPQNDNTPGDKVDDRDIDTPEKTDIRTATCGDRDYRHVSWVRIMERHTGKKIQTRILERKIVGELFFLNRFYRCNRRLLSFSPTVNTIRCTADDDEGEESDE